MEDVVMALYGVLKDIFLLLDDGDRRLLATCNLTVSRFYALKHLGDTPGLSISELSARMFCDKSNVTRLVQSLEADDLVQRHAHEHDRRVQCLTLTAAGEKLRRDALSLHRRHNANRFRASMPEKKQAELLPTLQGLRDGLQSELKGSVPPHGAVNE